jgi:hypothetical protein
MMGTRMLFISCGRENEMLLEQSGQTIRIGKILARKASAGSPAAPPSPTP